MEVTSLNDLHNFVSRNPPLGALLHGPGHSEAAAAPGARQDAGALRHLGLAGARAEELPGVLAAQAGNLPGGCV